MAKIFKRFIAYKDGEKLFDQLCIFLKEEHFNKQAFDKVVQYIKENADVINKTDISKFYDLFGQKCAADVQLKYEMQPLKVALGSGPAVTKPVDAPVEMGEWLDPLPKDLLDALDSDEPA